MSKLEVRTLDGDVRALDAGAVDELEQKLWGPLLRPGADGYDAARQIFNGAHDKKPALIARCSGTAAKRYSSSGSSSWGSSGVT